jgi:hypothetical protein
LPYERNRSVSHAERAASRWTSFPPRQAARARRLTIFTICFALLIPIQLHAGGRRRAVSVSPPSEQLTIAFVDAPGGTIDTGAIVAASGTRRRNNGNAITKRTFGIRIGPPSRESRGSATIRAYLETADPRCIVRIDGVVLGTQPRTVERFAPIGIVTAHQLEIEVPASAAEGALVTTIGWEVATD